MQNNVEQDVPDRRGQSVFLSYSISNILAMTYAEARGETAREMALTLRFPVTDERLHKAAGTIMRHLNGSDRQRPSQIRVANAVWLQQGFGLSPETVRIAKTHYQSGLGQVDCYRDAER
jgi:serpin B